MHHALRIAPLTIDMAVGLLHPFGILVDRRINFQLRKSAPLASRHAAATFTPKLQENSVEPYRSSSFAGG